MAERESFTYELHGTRVADPYRWLEDGESEEVRRWTEEHNARVLAYLRAVPGVDALRARVGALLRIGFASPPAVRRTTGGTLRYFHERREGAQLQPVLCVREGEGGEDRVLLDASALSTDGTSAVDWWYVSPSGVRVAWGRSESGSEQSTLHVRDVATGEDLPVRIPGTQHGVVAWRDDDSFFYVRFPAAGTVPPGEEQYGGKVFEHVIGRDAAEDAVVFGEGLDKTDLPQPLLAPGGRWLVVVVAQGWGKTEVHLCDLQAPAPSFVAVASGEEAIFEAIPCRDRLYLFTNSGAPRYRLVAVDYARPERAAWVEILPEQPDVLTSVAVTETAVVASTLRDAASSVHVFGLDGAPRGQVTLPAMGSASVVSSPEAGTDEAFAAFASFASPPQALRLEVGASGATARVWDRVAGAVDERAIRVERLFATSRDGTRVPMFVLSRAGDPPGPRPTVLYGYGGFNVNQTPAFSSRALAFVERGGVWASAVLRGGGEYGEEWHRGGMLDRKQNVFDDFVACAERLIEGGVTTPEHLGILGGSNGGLLVAAALTQRPELFRAAVSLVPLTDMLRYHLFRLGRYWITEYGSPEDAAAFRVLEAYSPYHHVRAGVRYPAVLLATAESDSRVDPMHARKMAAALEAAGGERPVLLRVETKAGHGAGKPISKVEEQLALELGFLARELGVRLS